MDQSVLHGAGGPGGGGQGQGLHALLRERTAAAHAQLEGVLEAGGFFHTREGYTCFLLRWRRLQIAAERALLLARVERVLPDWHERCRAPLLDEDLIWLGRAPAPHEETLVDVHAPEHVLGLAYVLEGSTLGAAVLLPRLAPLGVTAAAGGRFLSAYGDRRGLMWRRFLAALAAWEARGIDGERLQQSAQRSFATAASVLNGGPAV